MHVHGRTPDGEGLTYPEGGGVQGGSANSESKNFAKNFIFKQKSLFLKKNARF